MADPALHGLSPGPTGAPGWLRDLAVGGAYWLAFLLLLEPGNLLAAHHAGSALDPAREALRITGATLIGVGATPIIFWLVRRHPVRGRDAGRNAALQAIGAGVIAAGMIVVSCLLAARLLGDRAALTEAIPIQLSANWTLLLYGIAAFLAAAQALRFLREAPNADAEPAYAAHATVTSGRRTLRLDLADVDWIETEGNYLALHAAGAIYLVRDTLQAFAARLDPGRFARIHRRRVVALDRIVEITSLEGGDAELRLRDGVTLRLSRSYRRSVRDRF